MKTLPEMLFSFCVAGKGRELLPGLLWGSAVCQMKEICGVSAGKRCWQGLSARFQWCKPALAAFPRSDRRKQSSMARGRGGMSPVGDGAGPAEHRLMLHPEFSLLVAGSQSPPPKGLIFHN